MSTAERIRFVSGAELTAADLSAEQRSEAYARELHVRAVHGTWGIALGYVAGAFGDYLVVGPGIAYDCRGRELVSSRTVSLETPRLPGDMAEAWFDLGIRLADDDEVRGGGEVCHTRPLERPHFIWVLAGEATSDHPPAPSTALRTGETVPIARARVDASGIVELSLAGRRAARPAAGARVAAGSVSVDIADGAVRSDHPIDTTAGGFHDPPFYFASLSTGSSASTEGPLHGDYLLGPFLSISDATSSGFTLTICTGEPEPSSLAHFAVTVTVDWIGVEPIRGCWPAVRPLAALVTAGEPLGSWIPELTAFVYQPPLGPFDPSFQEA